MPPAYAEIMTLLAEGRCDDPFGLLGLHADAGLIMRCFLPWASEVAVLDDVTGAVLAELPQVDPAGLFAGPIPGRTERFAYRLRARGPAGLVEFYDPYRFSPVLGDLDIHLLAEGTHLRAFDVLGAHPITRDGVPGIGFAVWAPNARQVSLVGSFNDWDARRHPMRRHPAAGLWDIFMPKLAPGHVYKFAIRGPHGEDLPQKADPYATEMELRPQTASVVSAPSTHVWRDQDWMARRWQNNERQAPISIYEVHLGSWRRRDGHYWLSYRELAEQLVPYVRDMGFTHIEIMPISEFPFDGSWGYQPIGLMAPTARFGTPDDFRYLVDACHAAGLALWLDWVPGHFPTDPHGLGQFDGTHLYEHADPRQGFHQDWNTLIFNYGRPEVRNYLIASALAWMERFHVDGLRVDAVASMLYLDYSRQPGQWVPNQFGGRENLEAIAFLRRTNELVFGQAPGATTAAEESTSWPRVSAPTYDGGLGFGFKWNMGWMHDTLNYMAFEPIHRKFHHHELTFGLLYAFSENFILPLSHDEVVHGKGSLLSRMPGDRWQRFANLRAYYGFMWTHPGKKLLFMGGEFAQEREWNHDASLDWHLLDDPLHIGVQSWVRDLNRLYRDEPGLHARDCDPGGFAWISSTDHAESCLSFLRRGHDPQDVFVIVCNFTPVPRHGYRLGVPWAGRYRERLNSDAALYGGSGMGNAGAVESQPWGWHGYGQSLELTLPPLATLVFSFDRAG